MDADLEPEHTRDTDTHIGTVGVAHTIQFTNPTVSQSVVQRKDSETILTGF